MLAKWDPPHVVYFTTVCINTYIYIHVCKPTSDSIDGKHQSSWLITDWLHHMMFTCNRIPWVVNTTMTFFLALANWATSQVVYLLNTYE